MNVLLDECVPRPLRGELPGHTIRTVPEMGWAGVRNGELITLAEQQFDVFVTVDRGVRFQHSARRLSSSAMAFIILEARSNRLEDLLPAAPELRRRIAQVGPGQVMRIPAVA